jgi:hypothetical protein
VESVKIFVELGAIMGFSSSWRTSAPYRGSGEVPSRHSVMAEHISANLLELFQGEVYF